MDSLRWTSLISIEIGRDEIHLWETGLAVDEGELTRISSLLSPEESRVAAGFHDANARRQYIVSRGMLRELLARYVTTPAAGLRFETEGHGKPVLAGNRVVHFNLSHSGGLAVYAVAASRPVGVDLERLRPMPRAAELARRYLSPEESSAIATAPAELRDREFLSCWVKREAFAKARGSSVWRVLKSRHESDLTFESSPELPVVRLVDHSDAYVLAVAAAGRDWRVVLQGIIPSSRETVTGTVGERHPPGRSS
jgi:Phosphopantetheinyl transferase